MLSQPFAEYGRQRKKAAMASFFSLGKKCSGCGKIMSYEKRRDDFCSRSCGATFHNKRRMSSRPCRTCGIVVFGADRYFCGEHSAAPARRLYYFERWMCGDIDVKTVSIPLFIRENLERLAGYRCPECGWDKKNPVTGRAMLEIDHIDGDNGNHAPKNLRVLCPNCHSLTPTYRALNKAANAKRRAT